MKKAERMALAQTLKLGPEKRTKRISTSSIRSDTFSASNPEDALIEAIDQRHFLKKHSQWVEKLRTGKIDVNGALGELAPDVLLNLAYLAFSKDASSKTKLAAIQDWLDRAGYGKVQKHALATVDASQSKDALISILLGANKDLKAEGIEIVDDEDKAK